MSFTLWQLCLARLQDELPSTEFSMWIRPLHAELKDNTLALYAPNRFVLDWVKDKYITNINTLLKELSGTSMPLLRLEVRSTSTSRIFSQNRMVNNIISSSTLLKEKPVLTQTFYSNWNHVSITDDLIYRSNINNYYNFSNFIEGKSNQLAFAAARQVANNPGTAYNPLFLYGRTGLGKTHLIHAIGNSIIVGKPNAKVVYIHAERFVQDMVKALQNNAIEEFKRYYRSVEALIIDDIQFLANKERSQEEFFHTFNVLLEGNQQIILTSDRYPKEINGIEERLKSRFGWGLTVAIETPELETRVAILMKKADENGVSFPSEVAFFLAKHLRSNVRELEGALNRVIANVDFTGKMITIDFVCEVLSDLLALQEKLVTIEHIQKIVSEYYKIKLSDLLSKRRSRSIARPRQIAMAIAKELTNHSLAEIGNAFGGRDHTTVLHASRKIEILREENHNIKEDFSNLIRILSS